MHNLNLLVIFIAAMSTYVLGGIWYSPGLFGKIWHRESRDPRPYTPSRPIRVLSAGFLFSVIVVLEFANALGTNPSWSGGIGMGLFIGFCFAATSFGIHYQFANLSAKLLAIDGGFRIVQFAIIGWILAGLSIFGDANQSQYDLNQSVMPVVGEWVDGWRDYNLKAILIAAVSAVILAKIWYSPFLFGKIWTRVDAGRQQLRSGQHWRVWGLSLIFSLIAATAFAKWVGPYPLLNYSVMQGFLVGTCFVAASFVINYLCANNGWKMCLIDGGYHSAQFLLYGCVLGWMG